MMNHDLLNTGPPRTLPPMSPDDFALWGMAHVAYVKPLEIEGKTAFGIFAANGQRMGLTEDLDLARAVVIQNDLEPLSVH
ncbi:MAG: DUF1150 family protein [Rhodospirillales bacterium]